MKNYFKYFLALILCLVISGCSSGLNAGLEAYQSPDGRYGFFYPTGWTRVKVEGGPEIIYHDLINSNETLSLVISDVNKDIELEQLGTPLEVGQTLIDKVIAPEGSGRSVELINANQREASNHTFYDLEYALNLNNQDRHEIATVVIDRGSLYTFAVGTNQERWNKVEKLFANVIESFNFLI
ncbi:MAG: photosystem II oxygen evolving complex protein PsbP [Prochlorococcus sp. SP3034]|nr:photosystem II oxygen evolving complex protein PsbP [Prochlorococcus sp. SP3034]|tara:strand:+ start:18772 stop:19317 length:546 start_codon:yes stop_codon:yes gene_type:complete